MARVLALSSALDFHANAVRWGLKQRGHDMLLWDLGEFPSGQQATISLAPDGETIAFPLVGECWTSPLSLSSDFDVVWRRRPTQPVPSAELPESDRMVAKRESQVFCDAALSFLAASARWVNPEAAGSAANLKPLQLQAALKAGLKIPDTIFSNDPDEVRRFARKHGGKIIHKQFAPATWEVHGKHYVAETALIDETLLGNDFAIAAAPAIYQPYIDKRYELRVTVMGAVCAAAKLTLEGVSRLPVDLRSAYLVAKTVEVDLPTVIRDACLRLMADLGLVFGCLDLVATDQDELFFLEVNEMGQFLWLEDRNPDMPLLSLFTDFIVSGRPDFQHTARRDGVTFAAYRQSEEARALWRSLAALNRSSRGPESDGAQSGSGEWPHGCLGEGNDGPR